MMKFSKVQPAPPIDRTKKNGNDLEVELLHKALDSLDLFHQAENHSYDTSLNALESLKEQAFNFRTGFPVTLRHLYWSRLMMTHKTTKDILFDNFVKNPVFDETNQDVIRADVNRTRAYLPHFRDETVRYEMEILLTYYCKNKQLNYKQGMNELLAPFYCLKSNDVDLYQIYNLFSAFIDRFLPSMFSNSDFFRLQCSFVIFKHLLLYHHPVLANHLDFNNIAPELYVTPWFLTIFSSKNSLLHTFCFWDFYISYGCDKFYLFIALAFLLSNKELIMSTEVVRIPELINSLNFCSYEMIVKIWDLAIELKNQTPATFAKQLDNIQKNPIESYSILNDLELEPFMHIAPEEIISTQYHINLKNYTNNISSNLKYIFLDFRATIEYFSGRFPTAHRFDLQADWEADVTSFFNNLNGPFQIFQAKGMSQFDSGTHIQELDSELIMSLDLIKSVPLSHDIIKARKASKNHSFPSFKKLGSSSTLKTEKLSHNKAFCFDYKPNKTPQHHCCMIFNSLDNDMNYRIAGTIIRNLNLRWMSTVKGNFEACHHLIDELSLELVDHDRQHCLACKHLLNSTEDVSNFSAPHFDGYHSSFNFKSPMPEYGTQETVYLRSVVDSLKKIKNPISLNFMRTIDQHNIFKQDSGFQRTYSEISYSSTYTPSPVDQSYFPHKYLFGYFLWNTWIGTAEEENIICYDCQIEKMLVPVDSGNPFVKYKVEKKKDSPGYMEISSKLLGLHKLHHHMYSSHEMDKYNYQELFSSNISTSSRDKTSYKIPYLLSMETGDFELLPARLVLLPEHIILTTEPTKATENDIDDLKTYNFLDIAKLARFTLLHASSAKSDSYVSSSHFNSLTSDSDGYQKPEMKPQINDEFVKVLGIFSLTHLAKITSTKHSPSKRYFYFANQGQQKSTDTKDNSKDNAKDNSKDNTKDNSKDNTKDNSKDNPPWIKINFKSKTISDESTRKINAIFRAWKSRIT